MFKAPFSFDGRIRRIEYFLSGIVGGIVFSIAWYNRQIKKFPTEKQNVSLKHILT